MTITRRVENTNINFYSSASITSGTASTSKPLLHNIKGFSTVVSLTDNGSGAGSVYLQASVDDSTYVTIQTTTISFTTGAQSILYNVIDPMYGFIRVYFDVSAGDIAADCSITQVEG